jgi:hypothetical protein
MTGARLARLKNQDLKAVSLCRSALEFLSKSPYEWEYAQALVQSGACLPESADASAAQANMILRRLGVIRR